MRLTGRCALVTGAGRGIGLSIARAFAAQGAAVALADLDAETAIREAGTIEREGGRAIGVVMDVGDPEAVARGVAAAAAAFGSLDVLVNNAGIVSNRPFLELDLAEWDRVIRTNLTGSFLVAQAVARGMATTGGGAIVNIVSISGQRGGDGRAAYGSAKAGLELLTKVMAVELAPHAIRVNAIAPGPIETEMARVAHDATSRAVYTYLVPMSRYGTPEDIAEAAVFLCSDESRYVTAHTLNVDGGFAGGGLMVRKALPGTT